MSVWILAELDGRLPARITFELLTAGRIIADALGLPLGALVLGPGAATFAPQLVRLGADRVAVADHPALSLEASLELVTAALPALGATWLLAGHTRPGTELAARLAVRLEAGLLTACTALDCTDGAVTGTRSLPDGGTARVAVTTPVGVLTIQPGTFAWPAEEPERPGDVVRLEVPTEVSAARVRLLSAP